jgi:hypothetical protein
LSDIRSKAYDRKRGKDTKRSSLCLISIPPHHHDDNGNDRSEDEERVDVILREIASFVGPPIHRRDQQVQQEAKAKRENNFGQSRNWLVETEDTVEEILNVLEHESGRCLGPEIGRGEKQKKPKTPLNRHG